MNKRMTSLIALTVGATAYTLTMQQKRNKLDAIEKTTKKIWHVFRKQWLE